MSEETSNMTSMDAALLRRAARSAADFAESMRKVQAVINARPMSTDEIRRALSPIDTLLERDSIAVAHDPQHTPPAAALAELMDPPPAGMVGRILEHVRRLHTNGDHK